MKHKETLIIPNLELKIQSLVTLDKHFVTIKWFAAEQGEE